MERPKDIESIEYGAVETIRLGRPPLPKEHGAYAIFFAGILIGVAVAGGGGAASLLLLCSAFFAFLARVPVMSIRKDTSDFPAWAWAFIYGALSGITLLPLIFYFKLYWLIPLGILGAAAFGVHLLLLRDRLDRSIGGEMSGIGGLSLVVPAAYYASGGTLGMEAMGIWILSLFYFWGSIFHVKLIIALKKPGTKNVAKEKQYSMVYHALALICASGLALFGVVPIIAPLALVPIFGKAFHLALFKKPPLKISIKRVGALELIHTLVFVAIAITSYLVQL